MDSGMIGKIEKARRYAREPHRFHIESLSVRIDGENNSHLVHLANGKWRCDCEFFQSRKVCTHTMALEELLKGMLVLEN